MGFIAFASILASGFKLDLSIVTNIAIAFATIVATLIHYDSKKQQQRNRVWEINKPILLDLSKSLSAVVKADKFYLQERCAKVFGDAKPNPDHEPASGVYEDFFNKREYALVVYKSLMDDELLNALEEAMQENIKMSQLAYEYNIDEGSVYEKAINVNQALKDKLDRFIIKLSGIKDI